MKTEFALIGLLLFGLLVQGLTARYIKNSVNINDKNKVFIVDFYIIDYLYLDCVLFH